MKELISSLFVAKLTRAIAIVFSFFTFSFFAVPLQAKAENLNALTSFPSDNLLSFQFIPAMAQAPDGFMWFGSNAGLHRFDGHTMINYHHDESNSNSIGPGGVRQIFFDSKGRMWVGLSGGGLDLYDPDTDSFITIDTNTSPLNLMDNLIHSIIEDNEEKLWVATDNGITIIDYDNKLAKHMIYKENVKRGLNVKAVVDLIQTHNNTVWAATVKGISIFTVDGEFIRNILPTQLVEGVNSDYVRTLEQQSDGTIWIGTGSDGLIRYTPISSDFRQFVKDEGDNKTLTSNSIYRIFEDSRNQIWVGTDKGLSIFDESNNSFRNYDHNPNDPNSLTNDVVREIFEDKQGMVWLSTLGGVNLWNPNLTAFERYTPLNHPVLTNSHISGFSQWNKQQVYVATYDGGIYLLDTTTNQLTKLDLNDYFKNVSITAMKAENNQIWIGTRASGLYKVDLNSKEIFNYKQDQTDPTSISDNGITSIVRDHLGSLWAATFGKGINRLNQDNTFTHFSVNSNQPNKGPSSDKVIQIITDNRGYLWLATYGGGINRFDLATQTFVHLIHRKDDPKGLRSNMIWAIHKDHKDNLWIGTRDKGLNFLSSNNQQQENWQFEHIDLVNGMISSTVYGITEDVNGDIWIITSQGISQYSPLTLKFSHFDRSHGLVDMEFNQGAVFRDINKELYFGSTKGFNTINPETVELSYASPTIHLTNILRMNEPMRFDNALSKIDNLTFEYSDRLISFEYVGLNYADPQATIYRYRLHGFDNEWIDAGKFKRATYTNLPSGDYQFEVVAASHNDNWTPQGHKLNISIKPAPWRTWWAYLLYATSIALALLGYSKYVNRKLQSEQQQKIYLKQQVEEQTKEFQLKNIELQHANKQLENAATTDKLTGVRSRRYLDIYIEQATQLMSQIHLNILPVQRNILPRLYFLMVRIGDVNKVTASQLVNLTDLLLYTRNDDDLVIRWSEDTFAVIGYEKDDNARELATRLVDRFDKIFDQEVSIDMAYSFYPFNFEQPMALSWDQVSVLTEFGLNHVKQDPIMDWIGLYAPKEQPFDYLQALKMTRTEDIAQVIKIRQSA